MSAASKPRNVFVYGSLLAPEVLAALLHRVPRASLAVVHDYRRYNLKDRMYAAAAPSSGDKVFGKVLYDLTEQEIKILDKFQDTEYTRVAVSPLLLQAFDLDGELVDNGWAKSPNGAAHNITGASCLDLVANASTLASAETDGVSAGNNTVVIPPDRIVGMTSLESEVKAYMYIWATKKDPNLSGNWDYEAWRAKHLTKYLAKYTVKKEVPSRFRTCRSEPA